MLLELSPIGAHDRVDPSPPSVGAGFESAFPTRRLQVNLVVVDVLRLYRRRQGLVVRNWDLIQDVEVIQATTSTMNGHA